LHLQGIQLPQHHQAITDRFTAACQADERVVAAFLGGSYARGAADEYSDLDLYLITTDEAFDDFVAGHEAFMRLLGEPVFLEDFDLPNIVFYFFSDGTEGELGLGRESEFHPIHGGPYRVLVDKKNILAGVVFPSHQPDSTGQIETLRRLVYWFWHDLSHFITAMGRGQLWWAYGQLEVLRRLAVSLARLDYDFFAEADDDEPYFKVEKAIPIERLSALQATFCPMEPEAMLQASLVIFSFYQQLAPALARTQGIPYPVALERVMTDRLNKLSDKGLH
jgi:predicted nucleotidyltransferase